MTEKDSEHLSTYKITFLIGICILMIVLCTLAAFILSGHFFLSDNDPDVSEEQVRQIALQDAGEELSNVTFTRNVLETDNDREVYRVEFYSDKHNYQYMIDGHTGSISRRNVQSSEKETPVPAEDSSGPSEKSKENALSYIGVRRAQKIVLEDADLSSDEVTFEKAALDHEKSLVVYDLQFIAHHIEYEYKVNALNGSIVEMEKEFDDDDD